MYLQYKYGGVSGCEVGNQVLTLLCCVNILEDVHDVYPRGVLGLPNDRDVPPMFPKMDPFLGQKKDEKYTHF